MIQSFSCLIASLGVCFSVAAQNTVSKVWVADNGNGTYKNPVLHADYSDPDAIRVGDDFYLTSSSFEDVPGLPILHSKDLVNWSLVGHALQRQPPYQHFETPRHGEGVWAPSLRYHKGEFYIYYPDPDFGIYCIKATKAEGPWSQPVLVKEGKGLIDPCPLWDDNGKTYLVHAFAGSRAGIKSILVMHELSNDGLQVSDAGKIVYDGHKFDPTLEGPKLYKRNGYYYIFAPAGGVATGWQLVLRSRNIYGPYERKVVMDAGNTPINGPHQGAWVTTQTGEDWFLHFQDKDAYGRVVHLQPMAWQEDWPVIGVDKDGDGKGEPVLTYQKPDVGKTYPVKTPAESDEFESNTLGLQWQWMSNPKPYYSFMNTAEGTLRLYAYHNTDSAKNLWQQPNVLLQKLPAEECIITAKLSFTPNTKSTGERTGLVMMGMSYAGLALHAHGDSMSLAYIVCNNATEGNRETTIPVTAITSPVVHLRISVRKEGKCTFSYSTDGKKYIAAGEPFTAVQGRWKGAKTGIFCTGTQKTNDSGYADFDWFRIEPLNNK